MQLQLTTTQAAASSYFLLFDKDELVITDALLHNLLSLAKHSGLKRLLSFQIGQRRADGGYEWTNTHKVKHEYLLVETLNLSVWQTHLNAYVNIKSSKCQSTQTAAYFFLTSCCLCDAFEVPLQNSSNSHGSYIHKILQTHVINATSRQYNICAWCQNLLDPLLGNIRFPATNQKYIFSFTSTFPLFWALLSVSQ